MRQIIANSLGRSSSTPVAKGEVTDVTEISCQRQTAHDARGEADKGG